METAVDLTLTDYVGLVREVQGRRAEAHARFAAALRESVEELKHTAGHGVPSDQSKYERMVATVTNELVQMNEEMEKLESVLVDRTDARDLLQMVKQLQVLEDECVSTSVSVHVLKRSKAAGLFAPNGVEEGDDTAGTIDFKLGIYAKKLQSVEEQLNELSSELMEMELESQPSEELED